MAVYPIKYGNSYYLNEVALEGSWQKVVTEPVFSFKFLKFSETSFNHNVNNNLPSATNSASSSGFTDKTNMATEMTWFPSFHLQSMSIPEKRLVKRILQWIR